MGLGPWDGERVWWESVWEGGGQGILQQAPLRVGWGGLGDAGGVGEIGLSQAVVQ
jgi:hypothetical protein